MAAAGVAVKEVATTKIDGQKTGTSGLRKKAKEFSSGSYLANWVQSLFNALPKEQRVRDGFVGSARASLLRPLRAPPRHGSRSASISFVSLAGAGGARASHAAARRIGRGYPVEHNRSRCCATRANAPAADECARAVYLVCPSPQDGATMVLGGDGRWFNKQAAQIIIKLAAGNGVAKMYVGRDGFLCTPAASAVIRARKASGGFIMSASHNPGGPENDWGIKFNASNGEPAPEKLTDAIYGFTQSVSVLKFGDIPDVDLSRVGVTRFGSFEVEVIDPVADYLTLFKARQPRMRRAVRRQLTPLA